MLLYTQHVSSVCVSVALVWSVSRSPLLLLHSQLLLPLLPHDVAARIQRCMQQHPPTWPLQSPVWLSFALSVLSAPFACIFILKITQVADRQQQPCVLCGNFGSLARNKNQKKKKEWKIRREKQRQHHVNFYRHTMKPHNECCLAASRRGC